MISYDNQAEIVNVTSCIFGGICVWRLVNIPPLVSLYFIFTLERIKDFGTFYNLVSTLNDAKEK